MSAVFAGQPSIVVRIHEREAVITNPLGGGLRGVTGSLERTMWRTREVPKN